MHVIRNTGIIQRILAESSTKKIGICGYDRAALSLEKLLHNMGADVSIFVVLEDDYEDYEDERVIGVEGLKDWAKGSLFLIEPHFARVYVKYKHALRDMGLTAWEDYVHIFSSTIHEDLIIKHPDWLDVNLGVLWKQDQDGFRIFGSDREDSYTIVTLGGSNTYADWLVYAKSWSELLYEKFRDNGRENVKILCGGAPGFGSTQELMKFLRDVVPMKPDLVLCYSGLNDVVDSHGDFCDTGSGYPFAFPRLLQRLERFAEDAESRLPLYIGRKSEQSVEDIWILNQKIMHFVAQEMEIEFYTFLQPMLYYRNYRIDPELAVKLEELKKNDRFRYAFEHREAFCNTVKERTAELDYIIDFTGIYDGYSKLFIDGSHVNEWGNQIIADRIFDFIKQKLTGSRQNGSD